MYSTPSRPPSPLSAKVSLRKRLPWASATLLMLTYLMVPEKNLRPPPKTCFHHPRRYPGPKLCMYPWSSPSFHSPYSHPIIFPRGCPFQVDVGAVHWYPSGLRPGRPALPTCVPAWRHSSAADTPPIPTSHPAGRREALCPHFPLLLVPVARRALDWPAHRCPRSPLASGGRPSPDPGRGGRSQGGSPLCPQSQPRIPDGARPSGGAEPAHSPDLFPRSACRRPCCPSPPRHCGRPAPFLGPAGPPHPCRVGAAPPAA